MKTIIKILVGLMLVSLVACANETVVEEATSEVETNEENKIADIDETEETEINTSTNESLKNLREQYEPCFLMVAYLGDYYDEVNYQTLIEEKAQEEEFSFISDIDANHTIKRYEEGCEMEVYLIVPSSGSDVSVNYYELASSEVSDVLYKGEDEPFLLLVPDLYGDPAVEIDVVNELGMTWFYPSLELSDGSVRTNDSEGIIDITSSEQIRPLYIQSLFDELSSREEIMARNQDLQILDDALIEGHYYAVFANSNDLENCGNYYAIRPGTYETYWSCDLTNWTKVN